MVSTLKFRRAAAELRPEPDVEITFYQDTPRKIARLTHVLQVA
ncbi:MAG: hypothetical protein ACXV5N_02980 [Halobacteriota archaeon]